MPQCEECPNEVDEGKKLCRYHSAKYQAKRASRAETVTKWSGKTLPILLQMVVPGVRRFWIGRR